MAIAACAPRRLNAVLHKRARGLCAVARVVGSCDMSARRCEIVCLSAGNCINVDYGKRSIKWLIDGFVVVIIVGLTGDYIVLNCTRYFVLVCRRV